MIRAALLTVLFLIGSIGLGGQTSKNGQSGDKAPPVAPILRIEAGGHTAPITGIAADPAGRFLVTVSHDKSARVWELPSLRLIRILRPPLGLTPDEGKLYALAISPDGRQVAVGGWTGIEWGEEACLYFFDLASGKLVRVVRGLPHVIDSIAYARDGLRVAVGMGAGGVRVFSAEDGSPAFADEDYSDSVYGLDFDRSGRLFACSRDGSVRSYDVHGHVVAQVKRLEGEPYSLAISPDGNRLAVGGTDKAGVVILLASTLAPLYRAVTADLSQAVQCVAWSSDGSTLSAAGYAEVVGNQKEGGGVQTIVRTWSDAGRGAPKDSPVAGNTVFGLASTPGGIAFAAGDGFGILTDDGAVRHVRLPIGDPRSYRDGFRVTPDGNGVWFSLQRAGADRVAYSVSGRELIDNSSGEATTQSGTPPKVETDRFKVTDWINDEHPKWNGVPLPLRKDETSRCLAILPDSSGFVIGTDWYLRRFGADAKEIWHVDTPAAAWSINVSADRPVFVVAYSDGTVRWYRLRDGTELLALYANTDKKRWVLWTPSGYYDCSPGGEDLLGWSVNNSAQHEADFYPASRFRSTYYRPDVLARVLATLDEGQAIAQANAATGRSAAASITALLPPVVRIVAVGRGGTPERPTVNVRYAIRTQTADPVKTIDFYIGGRRARTDSGLTLAATQEVVREISLDAPPAATVVAIQAWNRSPSEFARAEIASSRSGPSSSDPVRPGVGLHHLRVLSIGVGKFEKEPKLNLRLPGKDARDFAAAMRAQAALYGACDARTLCDDTAHHNQILDAFHWLKDETQDGDVTMIYISGHGMQDRSREYYFLPCDFEQGHEERTAISFAELYVLVRSLTHHGVVYVFLDTCHASAALSAIDSTGLAGNLKEIAGAVVVCACQGSEAAEERSDWGNGAFTKLLLDGLKAGGATADANGFISAGVLFDYIQAHMDKLNPRQHPTVMAPPSTPHLVFARRTP